MTLPRGLAWLAFAYVLLVFLLAFAIPVTQLVIWTWRVQAQDLDSRYWGFAWHSLLLAVLGSLIVVVVALLLSYAGRKRPGVAMTWTLRLATLGYAFPGAVLAVGLFIPVATLDNALISLAKSAFGFAAPKY